MVRRPKFSLGNILPMPAITLPDQSVRQFDGAVTGATVADRWDGETLTYTPVTAAEVNDSYFQEAGEQVIDLSDVSDPEELDGRTIEVSGDVGRIEVIVPEDMDVAITANMDGPGGYDLFGMQGGGIDWNRSASHDGGPGAPSLVIEADLDLGEITADTAP